ncbi:hypothetical protein [Rugosimonospora africana]|uniref:Uncharacterized protein n=1 Tax=Rugosimonospora africana TaxID=556532 RepID=A0A8J3VQ37_9ACTN|nr:hypothetical protein [Rugosimonospora africana]GIH14739.1 hypothetical protein Raf01_29110 [Rugosimonospora africana]
MTSTVTSQKTQRLTVTRSPTSRHRRSERRLRPEVLLALVAGGWAVATAAHLLGADLLLPPLVLIVTASLLRAGRTLLDRLMLALFLLLGTACGAGLLLSVWPWGLAPVPVAGVALTVLAVLGTVSGRRPALPRPAIADVVTVAATAAVAAYLAMPYLRANLAGRIALAMAGEDLTRHVTVFDGIRQVGGYLFLHDGQARRYVYSGMIRYPQGFHFVSALLDGYLPHHDSSGVTAFNHLIGFHVAGYALMTLSILWGARWIGGRLLATAWRWLPVVVLLSALCVKGELTADFVDGYPSEIAGLALVAGLIAVLARPVAGRRTQLLLVGSLLVALGFTYYLFLPGMGLAAVVWLVLRRRRLPHPAFTAAVALSTGVLALLPLSLGVLGGGQTESLKTAAAFHNSRAALIALALLVAAGVFGPTGRCPVVWRLYRWSAVSLLGYVLLLGAYQKVTTGHTGYYFEKSLHGAQVVLLVGLGSLVTLLPAPVRRAHRSRLAMALPSLLVAAAIGAGLGLVRGDSPYRPIAGSADGNWGTAWQSHRLAPTRLGVMAADLVARYREHPGSGVTLLLGDDAYANYSVSLFAAALERNAGTPISRGFYIGHLPGASNEAVRAMILRIGVPIVAVVTSPRIATLIRDLQRTNPRQHIELIDLSGAKA